MEKNWSYTIPDGPHAGKTLWSGRYCAVAGFVFRRIEGIWSVLANKRGSGTPDYQGCWNAVCGFLEANESAEQGCSREVFEETGYEIKPEKFLQVFTHTDPETSNNANVTIRHIAIFFEHELGNRKQSEGGEENEVDAVRWIPIEDIMDYTWAFNHEKIIHELFYDYVYPLTEYSGLQEGDYFMLGNRKWLNANLLVKNILKTKVLGTFEIYD
jgi:ADP-ribose pyrophosphatase YjhB (NUDIX family)